MAYLGLMYRDGRGVPQNYDSAYTWFNLAAAAGNEEAARERDTAAANNTLARQVAPVSGYTSLVDVFWLFAVFAMGFFFTAKWPFYQWAVNQTRRFAKEREQTQRERMQREQELARRRREKEEEARRQQEQEHANAQRSKPDSAKIHDWWVVLGTTPDANLEATKQVYRLKMKQYHPDRVAGLGPEFVRLAEQKSMELNEAM
jgi:TPR repeat protein